MYLYMKTNLLNMNNTNKNSAGDGDALLRTVSYYDESIDNFRSRRT